MDKLVFTDFYYEPQDNNTIIVFYHTTFAMMKDERLMEIFKKHLPDKRLEFVTSSDGIAFNKRMVYEGMRIYGADEAEIAALKLYLPLECRS